MYNSRKPVGKNGIHWDVIARGSPEDSFWHVYQELSKYYNPLARDTEVALPLKGNLPEKVRGKISNLEERIGEHNVINFLPVTYEGEHFTIHKHPTRHNVNIIYKGPSTDYSTCERFPAHTFRVWINRDADSNYERDEIIKRGEKF